MQDGELLRAYGVERDESAFGELIRRYVDLVYSTASRHLEGDSGLAEEVTQTVFLLLARKAVALAGHPSLAGWLYRTATQVAAKAKRSEFRRRAREREAVQMNTHDPNASDAEQILPLLDDALDTLSESDRLAVLLRFFLKKPMREVGLALGVSEAAAKMRVSRAVDRLREFFLKRGIACTSGVVAAILTDKSLRAAPQTLTTKIMSRLPDFSASMAAGSGLIQTLILMSKTNAKTLLIAALSGAALITVCVRFFSADSRSKQNQNGAPPAGASETADANTASRRTARLTELVGRNPTAAPTGSEDSSPAVRRLRAALSAPQPKGSRFWPDEEVILAVAGFTDRNAAFEVLKAAFANPEQLINEAIQAGGDPAQIVNEFVTTRSILAMGQLGQDVPEVVPYLWNLFRAGNFGPISPVFSAEAFSALQAIGLKPEDVSQLVEKIPALSGSPALRRYVPQAIADLIALDPQGTAASVGALENLLSHPDGNVRFCAACALARTRVDQDQRVAEILNSALVSSDSLMNRSSVEALAKAGDKAAEFVPALLELAKTTRDEYLRTDVLRAVAKIQPNAVDTLPEVAQVAANDATARDLSAKLKAGSASLDDLAALLPLQQQTVTAAFKLADIGPAAASAIPAMLQALQGRDEEQRERIVEAIHKINPQFQIDRVEERTISEAMLHTRVALGSKANDPNDPVFQFVMDRAKYESWWTRGEVIAFAKQLGSMDTNVQQAFVAQILERDPSFRESLDGQGK